MSQRKYLMKHTFNPGLILVLLFVFAGCAADEKKRTNAKPISFDPALATEVFIEDLADQFHFVELGKHPDFLISSITKLFVTDSLIVVTDRSQKTVFVFDRDGKPKIAPQNAHEVYRKVFDGEYWSSYNSTLHSGDWLGLRLAQPTRIDRITYTPRNRVNYIFPNNNMSYSIWTRNGGRQGSSQVHRIPSAMNKFRRTRCCICATTPMGVQERIFTYENGNTKWW